MFRAEASCLSVPLDTSAQPQAFRITTACAPPSLSHPPSSLRCNAHLRVQVFDTEQQQITHPRWQSGMIEVRAHMCVCVCEGEILAI